MRLTFTYLIITMFAVLAYSCQKEEATPPYDVVILDDKTPKDSSISELKMRVDEITIKSLPSLYFYNPNYNEYKFTVYLRSNSNELLFVDSKYVTNLPHTLHSFAVATDEKLRLMIEDQNNEFYHLFEVDPKNYQNQTDFTIALQDNLVEIELKGSMIQ